MSDVRPEPVHADKRPTPKLGTSRPLRRNNITSQASAESVNSGPSGHDENSLALCDSRNAWGPAETRARSASFAQPGGGERAEQQQQADQPGENRQYTDAPDDTRVAHLHAHPAVATEYAGCPH